MYYINHLWWYLLLSIVSRSIVCYIFGSPIVSEGNQKAACKVNPDFKRPGYIRIMEWEKYRAGLQVMHNKLETQNRVTQWKCIKTYQKPVQNYVTKIIKKKTIVKENVKSFIFFRVYYEWCGKSDWLFFVLWCCCLLLLCYCFLFFHSDWQMMIDCVCVNVIFIILTN